MSTIEAERERALEDAQHIMSRAKSAGRSLTPDERSTVEAKIKSAERLYGEIRDAREDRELRVKLGAVLGDDIPGAPLFSPQVKAGIESALRTGTSFRAEVDMKAALLSNTMLPPSGTVVQAGLHPNAQFPLTSLFGAAAAEGPIVRYYRMTAGTAAVVGEGALKPDAGVTVTGVDLPLSKIAATAQVSSEMQLDASFVVTSVQQELTAAILAAENKLVLDTFAATSGVLTGTGTTANVVDLVAAGIATMEGISGITPIAFIAHPSVVSTVRQAKAATAGTYVVDPTSPSPQSLHGVPIYSTPATAAGTAWLASGPGVTIFTRGGVIVNIGTNADDLVHNLSTIVAEERIGVAVTRPSSLYKLTLT